LEVFSNLFRPFLLASRRELCKLVRFYFLRLSLRYIRLRKAHRCGICRTFPCRNSRSRIRLCKTVPPCLSHRTNFWLF